MCQEHVVDKLVEYIYFNCCTICILLSSKAHGKKRQEINGIHVY